MKIAIVETDSKGGLIHYAYQLAEALAELRNFPAPKTRTTIKRMTRSSGSPRLGTGAS